MNGYVCFYNGKRLELVANSSYDAQKECARILKVKPGKTHMISVVLAEKSGETVKHVADF